MINSGVKVKLNLHIVLIKERVGSIQIFALRPHRNPLRKRRIVYVRAVARVLLPGNICEY
jgi:hypothetical protein